MMSALFLLSLLLPLRCIAAPQKIAVGEYQLEYEIARSGPDTILLEGGGRAGLDD